MVSWWQLIDFGDAWTDGDGGDSDRDEDSQTQWQLKLVVATY